MNTRELAEKLLAIDPPLPVCIGDDDGERHYEILAVRTEPDTETEYREADPSSPGNYLPGWRRAPHFVID